MTGTGSAADGEQPHPRQEHEESTRAQNSRTLLVVLLLAFGLCLIGNALLTGLTTFAYMPKRVHEFITVTPLAAGIYLVVLGIRARRLPAQRLRKTWRNLILLGVLSITGVAMVEVTHEQHRRFWQWLTPSFAREWRA